MPNIKLVTDSATGLTKAEINQYNITVVPLTVMIDDVIYVDGVTITSDEFPSLMRSAKALPKTSQPPIGSFVDAFDQAGEDGSQVLCIDIMESISGTVHAAHQASMLSTADVTVIDSKSGDRGSAFQILTAAKMIEAGATLDEITTELESIQQRTKAYLSVVDLHNLIAGGRISKAAGILTNLLNVKIVIEIVNGELVVQKKGRGIKPINRFFDNIYEEMSSGPKVKTIGISHVDAPEQAEIMKTALTVQFPDTEISVNAISPVLATHGGEGAFCLFYETE
ncbi:DegV family protein [Secundilactobacillus malefermentans]|uniref:DegV family protein n=1 Tax=Secundilactobacillus malefermentans TaxID=176292 RepID=A0A4R5NP39_9LACO|nr:DegV family protein [Secundilactobacillus malefermentans]KRM57908.1 hypothetical protein FD44_GL000937 [Secundilactobacillus malefermentans DSM 5705 = KCTC 3548]QEA31493.1 DegV family protein [Secundilactobacillus malefermentans]TDG78356.1 hypothetical protein C5L31_000107 [Secundilactobacillus malefermentans]